MASTGNAANVASSNLHLLGTICVGVLFIAAAAAGGFIAGYHQGAADQSVAVRTRGYSAPPKNGIDLLESLLTADQQTGVEITQDEPDAGSAGESADETAAPAIPACVSGSDQPNHPAHLTAARARGPARAAMAANSGAESIANSTHLQVSAGPNYASATRLAAQLSAKGYPAVVYSGGADGLHRVILGPYADFHDALQAQANLQDEGRSTLIRVR